MRKYFKRLAPPTWAKKIIDNIMKNIIISIKNVTIYYEVIIGLQRIAFFTIIIEFYVIEYAKSSKSDVG